MKIVIVGHGDSLRRDYLGGLIDGFDFVCKVKRGVSKEKAYLEIPERAGSKCDAVAGPLRGNLKGTDVLGVSEFWPVRLMKHREDGDPTRWWDDLEKLERKSSIRIRTAYKALCYWGRIYKDISPIHGPSSGMEAIVIALEHFMPKELVLAGFDAIRTGQTSTWSKKLGKDPHPAKYEQEILGQMERYYNIKVNFL